MYKPEEKIDNTLTTRLRDKIKEKLTPKIAKIFSPTALTVMGLIASIFAGLCFYLSNFHEYWLFIGAAAIFVNCFADEFDGAVARFKKQISGHGFFIDRMCDQLGIFFVLLGLGLSPLMHLSLALILVVLYFIIAMNTFLMAYATGKFRISYGLFGPVEMRLGMVVYFVLSPFSPFYKYPYLMFDTKFLGLQGIKGLDVVAFIGIILFTIIAVYSICSSIYVLAKARKNNS